MATNIQKIVDLMNYSNCVDQPGMIMLVNFENALAKYISWQLQEVFLILALMNT